MFTLARRKETRTARNFPRIVLPESEQPRHADYYGMGRLVEQPRKYVTIQFCKMPHQLAFNQLMDTRKNA
jgi:hypothetical protein